MSIVVNCGSLGDEKRIFHISGKSFNASKDSDRSMGCKCLLNGWRKKSLFAALEPSENLPKRPIPDRYTSHLTGMKIALNEKRKEREFVKDPKRNYVKS